MRKPEERYITYNEAGEIINTNSDFIRELAYRGAFGLYPLSRRVSRVKKSEFLRWVENQRKEFERI